MEILHKKNLITLSGVVITTGNTSLLNNLKVGGKITVAGFKCVPSGESNETSPLKAGTYGSLILYKRDGYNSRTCFINKKTGGYGGFNFQLYDIDGTYLKTPFKIDDNGNNTFYENCYLYDKCLYLRGSGDNNHGLIIVV